MRTAPKITTLWAGLSTSTRGHFLVFAAGDIASKALILASTSYLARTLGQSGFGQLAVAQGIVAYLAFGVDWGLGITGQRTIAKYPVSMPFQLANVLSIRFLSGLTLVIAIIPIALVLPNGIVNRPVFIAALLWLLPLALNTEWIFQGLQRFFVVSLSRVTREALMLAAFWLLVRDSSDVVTAAHSRWLAEAILRIGFLLLLLITDIPSWITIIPKIRRWPSMFRESIPLGLSSAFTTIYYGSLDVVLLGVWYDDATAGTYAAAYRLYIALAAILNILKLTYSPALAKASLTSQEDVQAVHGRFLQDGLVLSLPMAIGGLMGAPLIISTLYGADFSASVWILQFLAPLPIVIALSSTFVATLIQLGHDREVFWAYGIAALVTLVAYVALIYPFGVLGGIAATALGELTVLTISYARWRRIGLHLAGIGEKIPAIALSAAGFSFILYLGLSALSISLLLQLIICLVAGIVYVLLLMVLKVYRFGDLLRLKGKRLGAP